MFSDWVVLRVHTDTKDRHDRRVNSMHTHAVRQKHINEKSSPNSLVSP